MMDSGPPQISPSPQSISRLHLSVLFGSTMAYVGIALPFFPVFLAGKGLSDSEISLVIAVSLVARLLANPVVTAIADLRAGSACTLAICTIVAALLSAMLMVVSGFWQVIVLVGFLSVAQGSMMPLVDAITLGEIRRRTEAHEPPLDYGRLRVWGSGTVFAMMLAGGALVSVLPGDGIALLLALAALAPVLPALALARRSLPERAQKQEHQDAGGLASGMGLLALLILSSGLVQASHAMYYSFSSLHWKAQGLSPAFTGSAWALGVACEIVFFIVAGRMFGGASSAVRFLMIGALGSVVRWAAMSVDPSPLVLLGLQSLHALTFAATHLGSVYLLSSMAGPGRRAQVQGWLSATTSCGLALATTGVGQFYAETGEQAYWAMAAMAGAGLAGFTILAVAARPNR